MEAAITVSSRLEKGKEKEGEDGDDNYQKELGYGTTWYDYALRDDKHESLCAAEYFLKFEKTHRPKAGHGFPEGHPQCFKFEYVERSPGVKYFLYLVDMPHQDGQEISEKSYHKFALLYIPWRSAADIEALKQNIFRVSSYKMLWESYAASNSGKAGVKMGETTICHKI